MAKVDNTFIEDGRTYVSVEPCHWGMVQMPPPTPQNWLEGLRGYSKKFEPYKWPTKVVSIDA